MYMYIDFKDYIGAIGLFLLRVLTLVGATRRHVVSI